MTSDEYRLLIPSYLRGDLDPAESLNLEAELAQNAELRVELDGLRALWNDMGTLMERPQPSAALRARFYGALHALEGGRQEPISIRSRRPAVPAWLQRRGSLPVWAQVAAALVLFAAGLSVGRWQWTAGPRSVEMARMNSQVQNLRELVALSLLDRQSAASRLEGVAYSTSIESPKQEVVSALVRTLNHDANVNVRLSSLDALERFAQNAAVSKALVDALENQDSPLVQIALIDSLVTTHNRAATAELRKLTAASEVNPAVRQRAQWGLDKLTYQ